MSVILAGAAAGLYAAAVIGIHRWNVRRLRALSGGFRPLWRLDWDALLEGLLPEPSGDPLPAIPPRLPTGEPTPERLRHPVPPDAEPRRRLLMEVVAGAPLDPDVLDERAEAAGFSGGERAWIRTLAQLRDSPGAALETLEARRPATVAELYLREYLRLTLRTNALNLELSVFTAKRRIALGIARFGEAPCLFFVRALASSLIGLNRATIDDMARAVYFGRQAPFYVRAILETPYIFEARPALVFQCRQVLGSTTRSGR